MTDPKTPSSTSAPTPSSPSKDKPAKDRLIDEAKSAARTTMEDVATNATSRADAAKDTVADEMSGISSALRKAAQEMRGGSPQERTFGQIADGLADASDAVRDKDLGEMATDLSNFARRNPMVFIGGAVLVGFVATRFAVASSDTARGSEPSISGGMST